MKTFLALMSVILVVAFILFAIYVAIMFWIGFAQNDQPQMFRYGMATIIMGIGGISGKVAQRK